MFVPDELSAKSRKRGGTAGVDYISRPYTG